jgi:hypothetical protein
MKDSAGRTSKDIANQALLRSEALTGVKGHRKRSWCRQIIKLLEGDQSIGGY